MAGKPALTLTSKSRSSSAWHQASWIEKHFLLDGNSWTAVRAWQLFTGSAPQPTAVVTLDPNAAWRLLSRGLRPERSDARIESDRGLGEACLRLVAMMA
jgi:hypothetical protein